MSTWESDKNWFFDNNCDFLWRNLLAFIQAKIKLAKVHLVIMTYVVLKERDATTFLGYIFNTWPWTTVENKE